MVDESSVDLLGLNTLGAVGVPAHTVGGGGGGGRDLVVAIPNQCNYYHGYTMEQQEQHQRQQQQQQLQHNQQHLHHYNYPSHQQLTRINNVSHQQEHSSVEMLQFQNVDFNQRPIDDAYDFRMANNQMQQQQQHSSCYSGIPSSPSPLAATASSSVASNPTYSILDDRTFAPPPPLPTQNNIVRLHFQYGERKETAVSGQCLPSFEKVMHSGKILARISIKSLITRCWKEVFWIIYGTTKLIVFRCMRDYEDWLLNTTISDEERNHLIKLQIDIEKDLNVHSIRGYQCTDVRPKSYRRRGILNQFKVDSMTPFGPSLVAAFGSSEKSEATVLHSLLNEMLKRSILNSSMLKLSFSNKPLNTPRSQSVKSMQSQWSSSAPSFALAPNERSNTNFITRLGTPRLESKSSTKL